MSREPLAGAVFVGVAIVGYCKPFFQTRQFAASFVVLVVVTLIMPYKNSLVALYFTGLYALILGIKNLIFLDRKQLYHLVSGLLILFLCIAFFSINKTELFLGKYILMGSALFFLAREFFVVFGVYEAQGIAGIHETEALEVNFFENRILAKKNFMALAFAFVMMEIIWAILLLPIGFLNSAALTVGSVLLIKNLAIHYMSGTLTRMRAFKKTALLIILWMAILLASKWTL